DDFFGGINDQFLFIDSGTSASDREFRVYDLSKQSKLLLSTVVMGDERIQLEKSILTFFEEGGSCGDQMSSESKENYLSRCLTKYKVDSKKIICKWDSHDNFNALDKEMKFNLENLKKETTGFYRCGFRE